MDEVRDVWIVKESVKSAHKRIDGLEKKVDDLTSLNIAVCRIGEKMEVVASDVSEMKQEVREVREKPAKRWESMVAQIIGLLVAAAFGALLMKIGISL